MGIMVGIAVCVGNKRAVATAESEPTGIMTFADPAMQALCAKTWGDGTNITYEQAREVTEIPKNWAKGNKTITSFNEIKYFKNCTSIGESAFNGCSSMALTSLELPQCTTIGNLAFNGCSSMALASLELPQCTSIGRSAFYGCSSMALTSLHLPLCTSIGSNAFNGCTSMALTSLELPQCTSIGASAFYGCSSMALTSLELPQCTSIGNYAFYGCSSLALTSLELPLCTRIGGSAFNGCPLLSEMTLQNVTTVGSRAFVGSTISKIKLPSVETMEAVVNYDGIFSYCTNLVLVDLGENCSSIGNESFGRWVGTSGKNITLICRASIPPTLGGAIINKGWIKATIGEIYVPDDSVEAYKTATNWSAYANIILPLSQFNG